LLLGFGGKNKHPSSFQTGKVSSKLFLLLVISLMHGKKAEKLF
jgi:hypothetical protein